MTPWASLVDGGGKLAAFQLGSGADGAHVSYPGTAGCLEWESGAVWVGKCPLQ